MIGGHWWKAHKEAFVFGFAGFGVTTALFLLNLLAS